MNEEEIKFTEYSHAKRAFEEGYIFELSDEKLKECVGMLATVYCTNVGLRQNLSTMSEMINGEITRRVIKRLDDEKKGIEKLFLILAVGSLIIGTI
ncbi:MAG: hypothetical protein ACQKBV_07850, partial [Puniceicoccales bacterium]